MPKRFIACGAIVPQEEIFFILRVPGSHCPDGLYVCGGLCLAKWEERQKEKRRW